MRPFALALIVAALLPAGLIYPLDSPFRLGTESFRPADLAQFGEELTATLDPAAIEGALARGAFLMTGLPLSDGRTVEVDLVQFSPFAPGGRIVAMTGQGPEDHPISEDRRYFKGAIPHRSESLAMFVFWKGGFSGFVDVDGWRYIYGSTVDQAGNLLAAVTRFDPTQFRGNYRDCDNDLKQAQTELPPPLHDPTANARVPSSGTLRAELAIDMDYEAYTYFGSVSNASSYAAALTAAVSVFYERDANTIVAIKELTVWTSTAAPYPYTHTTTSELLTDIKTYYTTYKGGLTRASAHLLSKKPLGGGIAYRRDGGLLCDNSWAFGINGIHGSYTYPTTAYTWDADCFAHELGHNFGSKHTHCYQDAGNCLDCCYASESGCCPGPATNVRGTIMSYCHLQPAGKDLVFGTYVSPIIRTGAVNGACVLEAGKPGTIGGNAAYWASNGLKVTKQTAPIATSFFIDDGSVESIYGCGTTSKLVWVNRFTPTAYPFTLSRVDVIIGNGDAGSGATVATGRAIRILVYYDPTANDDRTDATLLYSQDATIQVVSYSSWNSYTLTTPQTIPAGEFYVGIYDQVTDSPVNYIGDADTSANQSRSYRTCTSIAGNPAASSLTKDTSRNWAIRAFGTRTPGGNDVLLSWGTPCNNDTQPGQKYAVYQGTLSQLAVEGYNPSPLHCGVDALNTSRTEPGDAYYNIVPVVGPNEGGHGFSRPTPTVHCQTVNPDPVCN
jgi:hypothetical protein